MTKAVLINEETKFVDIIEDEIELEIYSDEIFKVKNPVDNSMWIYIGILFVPTRLKNNCLQTLSNSRCIAHNNWYNNQVDCPYRCKYHDNNDKEIHYTEVDKTDARFRVAKNWINNIVYEYCRAYPRFLCYNILGINLSNMNLELFGDSHDRDMAIYNRFYRTALTSGINYFYPKQKSIIIDRIYHDKGTQESHNLFPWHIIKKLNLEDKRILVKPENIEFIDSDHRISKLKESHFIQVIDLILGATFACLDSPSENYKKKTIGLLFKPALEAMLDRNKNLDTGSMYGKYYNSRYYRTYQTSFFPRNKMSINDAENQLDVYGKIAEEIPDSDNFYYDRPLLLEPTSQKTFNDF